MPETEANPGLETQIVDSVHAGVLVVNQDFEIVVWNRFMAVHSGKAAEDVLGRNLFACFPELPERWLKQKLRSVFVLGNRAFTSWEQRPYLFRFPHNRPITGGVDCMRQDCTFVPIRDATGTVTRICVTVFDTTDASIYQERLEETKRALEETSIRDGLTGTYNRGHIETRLQAEFDRAGRYGLALSALLLDVDHFKSVNDTYGHQAGDAVLRHLVQRIDRALRSSDIAGRFGGEEFMVVLPNTGLQGAVQVAERLRRDLHDSPAVHKDMTIPYTISVGVTALGDHTRGCEALVKEADIALYQAKETGRDRVCVCPMAGDSRK